MGLGVSILLHELAHAMAARSLGLRVDRITLFQLGGVSELRDEPDCAGAEMLMAVAGPTFSVAFGLLLAIGSGTATLIGWPPVIAFTLGYLAVLNLVVALFNMSPAFPIDGSPAFRALIWMVNKDLSKATVVAVRVSEVLALFLIGLGVANAFISGVTEGLWWVLLGLFIHFAAEGSLLALDAKRAFAGHPVGDLMVTALDTVPADMTLKRFVNDRLFASRHGFYAVSAGET